MVSSKIVPIRIPNDLLKEIDIVCKETGLTRSDVLRQSFILTRILLSGELPLSNFFNPDILNTPVTYLMNKIPNMIKNTPLQRYLKYLKK